MNHCIRHSNYHPDCIYCHNAGGNNHAASTGDNSSPSLLDTVIIAEAVSEVFSPSTDIAPDTSSSDFGGFDGGSSGGGGVTGDF